MLLYLISLEFPCTFEVEISQRQECVCACASIHVCVCTEMERKMFVKIDITCTWTEFSYLNEEKEMGLLNQQRVICRALENSPFICK